MSITKTISCRCISRLKALALIALALFLISCQGKKPTEARRYVVLSPEVAEIMAALEITGDIVGLTEECTFPADFAAIPKVGKFGMIRMEEVLKLEPEIVFTSGLEQDAISAQLRKLNIQVVSIYPHSLEDMYAAITSIGEITDRQQRAQTLIEELKAAIKKSTDKAKDMPSPKVYIEINRDPIMSASDQSFVGQIINTAGGQNIFPSLERDYARVSPEDVIKAGPDIIICFSQDSVTNIVRRKGWQNIPAIKQGNIYTEREINPDLIQRAGPRIHLGIARLHKLFSAWAKDQTP